MDMCEMMFIDMHGVTYANNLLKNPYAVDFFSKAILGRHLPPFN